MAKNQNTALKINDAGRDIIRTCEWVGLEAIQTTTGRWLIGYGHSRTSSEGMIITEAEADALLEEDLSAAEEIVRAAVRVPLGENAFSALGSLAFNIGADSFRRSAVVRRLNAGKFNDAAQAFFWWNRPASPDVDSPLPELTSRRAAEVALFLDPDGDTTAAHLARPAKEYPNRRKNLARSRTMRGAIIAGIAAAIELVKESVGLLELFHSDNPALRSIAEAFAQMPRSLSALLIVIALAAIMYIAYVRYDDWRRGIR